MERTWAQHLTGPPGHLLGKFFSFRRVESQCLLEDQREEHVDPSLAAIAQEVQYWSKPYGEQEVGGEKEDEGLCRPISPLPWRSWPLGLKVEPDEVIGQPRLQKTDFTGAFGFSLLSWIRPRAEAPENQA